MKTTIRTKLGPALLGPALLLSLAASAGAAAQAPSAAPVFLSGNVTVWEQAGRPLADRIAAAAADFKLKKQGAAFFVAYVFPCRHKIHHHGKCGSAGPFVVEVDDNEIEFEHRGRGESWETKDGKAPAGLLALCSSAAGEPRFEDVKLLDTEDIYEFKSLPVYWLGSVPVDDSLGLLEKEFERGSSELQESGLFVISAHDSPKAYDFLKSVALGSYRRDVRKNAVFWIGAAKDPRAVADLKSILAKSGDGDLREQAVFALSIHGSREALEELLDLAKSAPDREVRKKAIFWLGQKASEEAVRGLKEIVEGPDEDVKESAVFAISQLPKQRSVPMLIDIAKGNKSPSVRKKALFWLGQTGSEEAVKLFEEILL
ncbi:MAG: HEAT repeat domain-containing protein, partial [Candidatus Aminicenantes bacterium]|nr:HEAT repeat domain-containing protein [Candidatus Aminicenantes bacterium]